MLATRREQQITVGDRCTILGDYTRDELQEAVDRELAAAVVRR